MKSLIYLLIIAEITEQDPATVLYSRCLEARNILRVPRDTNLNNLRPRKPSHRRNLIKK